MRPVWVKRGLYWRITCFRARGEYMMRLDRLNKYSLFTAHGRRGVRTPVHTWGPPRPHLIGQCTYINTYMASMNQLTKMAVDQSCNKFQISLIRYLGLPHQQLPYFYFTFKSFTKAHNHYSSALSSAF
jgi:hypothetical protein